MSFLIVFLILITLPCIGHSSYDEGYYAYKNKNYSKAYIELLEPAKNGDPDAQYLIAFLHHYEHIEDYSSEKVIFWLTKAANNDFIPGQSFLSAMYFTGTHIKQDYAKALYWSEKAAKNGDTASQRFVGIMYFEGNKRAPADWRKAFAWLSLAAEKGDTIANKHLLDLLKSILPERLEQGKKLLQIYREKYGG